MTTLSERKLDFHSKHNTITLFQKTHTTHDTLFFTVSLAPLATPRGFTCNYCALLSLRCYTPLLPPLLLYGSKKNAGQPACGAGNENHPAFCMRGAGLCGAGRPALPPLFLMHSFLLLWLESKNMFSPPWMIQYMMIDWRT